MNSQLLWGTVEMLILEVLSRADSYGYSIAQAVMEGSRGTFEIKEGSLYPALHRMERQGLLSSYWIDTEEGRRRKYYKLTAAGAKLLEQRRAEWTSFAAGVNGVLGGARESMA